MSGVYDREPPPFIDVATTLRSCACGYLIVLAIYLNTLIMIALTLRQRSSDYPQKPQVVSVRPLKKAGTVERKEKSTLSLFSRYKEQLTQTTKEEQSTQSRSLSEELRTQLDSGLKPMEPNRTLKSARISIRLPRAPKGHHIEELDQMEKFLAEDDEQGK